MPPQSLDSYFAPPEDPRQKEREAVFAAAIANPMSPEELISGLKGFMRRHLVCPDYQLTILALWIMHTHCFKSFRVTPYLNIWSPDKQCGKTICMQLLSILSDRPWIPSGMTAPDLMRRISLDRPTVLLDDWHTTLKSSETQAVIGLLIAGSFSGNIYTTFNAKEHKDVPIFCPKAFAGPASLPPSLADRSIPIILQRRKPGESATPFWLMVAQRECSSIACALVNWARKNEDHIRDCAQAAQLSPLPRLSMRQQECALPLLAIARSIGGQWPRKVRKALLRAFGVHAHEQPIMGRELLTDIHNFFDLHREGGKITKVASSELLQYLINLDGRPWARYHKGKDLTYNGMRKLLRDFGIHRSSRPSINNKRVQGFYRRDFEDAWARYLSKTVPETQEARTSAEEVPTPAQEVPTFVQEVPTFAQEVPTENTGSPH